MLNAEEKCACAYVIGLIASVVNGTVPPKCKDEDWHKIIDFAKRQSVLNLVAYAAEELTEKPNGQIMRFLDEYRMQKIVIEARQELAARDACQKLDQMGVRHMLLKGSVMKNYYPSPDMRTMGDIDILIEADRCDEVVKAFLDDGFTFDGKGDLHSNVKKGSAYIEFHRAMVDSRHEILSAYYGDGFRLPHKCGGSEYEYKLTDEDFYVFLIAHIAKHYRYGGTGIRSLLDLYVYEKALPSLDFDYINAELDKIGLLVFSGKIRKIARDWYSGGFNGEFDLMSEYIVSGGVYGIKGTEMQNSFILNNLDENIQSKKIKNFFGIIFLNYDEMKIRYPFLENKKFLLPLFWIVRFFDTLLHNPYNAKGRFNDSKKIMNIDDKMVEIQKISGIKKL